MCKQKQTRLLAVASLLKVLNLKLTEFFRLKMGFFCCKNTKDEVFIEDSKTFSKHFRKHHFGRKRNHYDFRCPLCSTQLTNADHIKTHFKVFHRENVQFFEEDPQPNPSNPPQPATRQFPPFQSTNQHVQISSPSPFDLADLNEIFKRNANLVALSRLLALSACYLLPGGHGPPKV